MSVTSAPRPRVALAVTAIAAALLLTGCSGGDDEAAPSPSAASKGEVAEVVEEIGATPTESATPEATPEPTAEVTAEPTPAPGGLTAAQQALVDRLRPGAVSDCEGYPTAEGPGVPAAVECRTGDRTVQAYAYADTAAMSADAQARGDGLTKEGKCRDGDDIITTWVFNQVTQGDLVCRTIDNGSVVHWSHYSELVGFTLFGPAGGTKDLFGFWLGFEPI